MTNSSARSATSLKSRHPANKVTTVVCVSVSPRNNPHNDFCAPPPSNQGATTSNDFNFGGSDTNFSWSICSITSQHRLEHLRDDRVLARHRPVVDVRKIKGSYAFQQTTSRTEVGPESVL